MPAAVAAIDRCRSGGILSGPWAVSASSLPSPPLVLLLLLQLQQASGRIHHRLSFFSNTPYFYQFIFLPSQVPANPLPPAAHTFGKRAGPPLVQQSPKMPLEQTITIVNNSGKIISTVSAHCIRSDFPYSTRRPANAVQQAAPLLVTAVVLPSARCTSKAGSREIMADVSLAFSRASSCCPSSRRPRARTRTRKRSCATSARPSSAATPLTRRAARTAATTSASTTRRRTTTTATTTTSTTTRATTSTAMATPSTTTAAGGRTTSRAWRARGEATGRRTQGTATAAAGTMATAITTTEAARP